MQKYNVLIIPEREQEELDLDNENPDDDAGYPRSPASDAPESVFISANRVNNLNQTIHITSCNIIIYQHLIYF